MSFAARSFTALAVVLVLWAAVVGCGIPLGPAIQGSGIAQTESRQVGVFTEIEVGNAIELDVTIGPEPDLVVTADDNVLPFVKTEVSGERLRVYLNASANTNVTIKVSSTVPELRTLSADGAARTTVTGAEGERFELELSGASRCEFTGEVELMEVNISGASHASLVGAAKELILDGSGASHLKAAEFKADKVLAEVNGASTVDVYASEAIKAEATGASTVRFAGQPSQIEEQTSGAATIGPREK